MKKIVKLLFLASLLLLSSQALGETGLEPLSLSISLDRDTVDIEPHPVKWTMK